MKFYSLLSTFTTLEKPVDSGACETIKSCWTGPNSILSVKFRVSCLSSFEAVDEHVSGM